MSTSKNSYNNDINQVKDLIGDDLKIIDEMLKNSVAESADLTKDASEKIFMSGGKRIRPSLTLLFAKLFSFNEASIYNIAVAVELIHTATLLHDDVIDNSSKRRGNKSTNFEYGNKASILIGDYIFAESFKYMVKSSSLDVLNILASASAIIANGEVKQLEALNKVSFDENIYIDVVKAKTAELFAACCQASAVISARSTSEKRMAYDFGLNLGIAFQIIDDLMDYDLKLNFGKNIGDDFYEKKITLPIISLYKILPSSEKKIIESYFAEKDLTSSDLNFVISLLSDKNIFNYVRDIANQYISNSLKLLDFFPKNEANDMLRLICNMVIYRDK